MPGLCHIAVRSTGSARDRAVAHDGEAGFTLLEVLVALGILGLSLSVLLGVFTTALDRTRANRTRTAAEHFAQALLLQAETTAPAALHETHGRAAPGFDWSLTTKLYGSEADRKAWKGNPVQIHVKVQWQDHGRDRNLSLSTLRILPGEDHD